MLSLVVRLIPWPLWFETKVWIVSGVDASALPGSLISMFTANATPTVGVTRSFISAPSPSDTRLDAGSMVTLGRGALSMRVSVTLPIAVLSCVAVSGWVCGGKYSGELSAASRSGATRANVAVSRPESIVIVVVPPAPVTWLPLTSSFAPPQVRSTVSAVGNRTSLVMVSTAMTVAPPSTMLALLSPMALVVAPSTVNAHSGTTGVALSLATPPAPAVLCARSSKSYSVPGSSGSMISPLRFASPSPLSGTMAHPSSAMVPGAHVISPSSE